MLDCCRVAAAWYWQPNQPIISFFLFFNFFVHILLSAKKFKKGSKFTYYTWYKILYSVQGGPHFLKLRFHFSFCKMYRALFYFLLSNFSFWNNQLPVYLFAILYIPYDRYLHRLYIILLRKKEILKLNQPRARSEAEEIQPAKTKKLYCIITIIMIILLFIILLMLYDVRNMLSVYIILLMHTESFLIFVVVSILTSLL